MADTERLPLVGACLRCKAMEAVLPPRELLLALTSADWSPADSAFLPRQNTLEQSVASELLVHAIGHYTRAYGVEVAGGRLRAILDDLRARARSLRISRRILDARADINARARMAWERGDTDAMRAIEDEPTPDYPGKAQDDAWLSVGQPAAQKIREVVG